MTYGQYGQTPLDKHYMAFPCMGHPFLSHSNESVREAPGCPGSKSAGQLCEGSFYRAFPSGFREPPTCTECDWGFEKVQFLS